MNLTLVGVTIVVLTLSSQLLHEILLNFLPTLSLCTVIPVVGLILVPITWLGSPKDFWLVYIYCSVFTRQNSISN